MALSHEPTMQMAPPESMRLDALRPQNLTAIPTSSSASRKSLVKENKHDEHRMQQGNRLNIEFQLELEARHKHIADALNAAERRREKRIHLKFQHLRVSLAGKDILKGISGEAAPGQLLSIMGPSGSGKTTLLNALAGRQKLKSGNITLNGQPQLKAMKRHVAYVLQDELFFGSLTVRQVMYFTAQIRLKDTMTTKQKQQRADQVMQLLGIDSCADSIVGNNLKRGISGGEKRRLSVGVQLITWPSLILLDEPTSGLDSSTAYDLVLLTRELTKRSCTVVCTLHQPSSAIFQLFDKLLVVANGETFYYGEAKSVVSHIEKIGFRCPLTYNPGDFVLELAKSKAALTKFMSLPVKDRCSFKLSETSVSDRQVSLNLRSTNSSISMKRLGSDTFTTPSVTDLKFIDVDLEASHLSLDEGKTEVTLGLGPKKRAAASNWDNKFPTSWWTQACALYKRSAAVKKAKIFEVYDLIQVAFLSILVSLIFFQMEDKEEAIQDRFGLVFFIGVYWMFHPIFGAVATFADERAILLRERAQGSYRLSAYYVAKLVAEMPLNWFSPSLFIIIVYWMTGLNNDVTVFFRFWALLILNVEFAMSLGYLISAGQSVTKKALATVSMLVLGSMLLGGFYLDPDNIPIYLRWMQWLSFIRYSFGALTTTVFTRDLTFSCAEESEFSACDIGGAGVITGEDVLANRNIDNLPVLYPLVIFFGMIALKIATYIVLFYRYKPTSPTK